MGRKGATEQKGQEHGKDGNQRHEQKSEQLEERTGGGQLRRKLGKLQAYIHAVYTRTRWEWEISNDP